MMKKTLIASALATFFTANLAIASDDTEQLRKVITEQQAALAALEKRLDDTEAKVEATAEQVDLSSAGTSATTLGGYGELHYNNLSYDKGESQKAIDFHRFVLYVGHEFSDNIRLFSELELEHSLAGDGKPGEIELEQAYIEIDNTEHLTSKIGLFLVPVGILNETHEPETFYGVERNGVEKNIIPATWWEAGLAANYQIAPGLGIDGAVTSGLEVSDDFKIRGGRQKVAKANAENLAYTSRLKYTGVTGLELATTLQYQTDITQGGANFADPIDNASAVMFEAHVVYQITDFSLRALYAQWNISGAEAKALGRDRQNGFYIEPSYRFTDKVGAYVRYSEYDNNAGNNADTALKQTSLGLNYYIHPNVVLKADYEDNSGAKEFHGFNLGVGYSF